MTRLLEYKPEFCDMLIAHMREGLSFESFAGVACVSKQCLYNWREKYPEFLEAYEIGASGSRLVWEKLLIDGANGKISNYNATSVIFGLKNRFHEDWKDRHDIAATVETSPQFALLLAITKLTPDQREARLKAIQAGDQDMISAANMLNEAREIEDGASDPESGGASVNLD